MPFQIWIFLLWKKFCNFFFFKITQSLSISQYRDIWGTICHQGGEHKLGFSPIVRDLNDFRLKHLSVGFRISEVFFWCEAKNSEKSLFLYWMCLFLFFTVVRCFTFSLQSMHLSRSKFFCCEEKHTPSSRPTSSFRARIRKV